MHLPIRTRAHCRPLRLATGSWLRFHDVDAVSFKDGQFPCAGFRRIGNPRRGGYDWVMGGILCAPRGQILTNQQFGQFIDRVRLQ